MHDDLRRFFRDPHGAQVVEYALVIAIVSIALVVALQAPAIAASFASFIGRVGTCLAGAACS